MKTVIIQHEQETPAGTSLQWLINKKIPFEIIQADQVDFSRIGEFENLIICGGSMNVDEENQYPWLRAEKKFIEHSLAAKKNILGLCLGGQLISQVLGARVEPMTAEKDQWELGWHEIQWKNSKQNITVFHWHRYQFSLPAGAELLASSRLCPNQAYIYGGNVSAVQFHPEVDLAWIQMALDGYEPPAKGDIQTAEQIQKMNSLYLPKAKEWYFSFLDRSLRH
jgi:GMP synthase (glutamine-hydrolysing)